MENINENILGFIVSNILAINNLTAESTEYNLVKLWTDKVCNEILIKTNRVRFPEELKYLAIDLVNDLFDEHKNYSAENAGKVQSMSEDGRSVSFGIDGASQNKLNALIQRKIAEESKIINKYKLLYKEGCKHG